MKKAVALFLAALLTVFSLSACGTDNNADDSGSQNGETSYDGSAENGDGVTGSNSGSAASDGTTSSGSASSGSATRQKSILEPATYDQMVRNARVHDADGDLSDHENSVTPGTLY